MGAEAQGMVAGDLVNTASRIQARGRAGDRAGRRRHPPSHRGGAAYEDGGERTLKGRTEPMQLVARAAGGGGRGGALKAEGLEAPVRGAGAGAAA